MSEYQTEIVIPEDRLVVLRLPDAWPVGLATVIVRVTAGDDRGRSVESDGIDWHESDIEWWEEFEDQTEAHASVENSS